MVDWDTSKLTLVRVRPDGAKVWYDPNDSRRIVITDIAFLRGRGGRPRKEPKAQPRVCESAQRAKLALALETAQQIEKDVSERTLKSYAEGAAKHGLSRPQLSRLLRLTKLAPEIVQELLSLKIIDGVEPPITERALRPLAAMKSWDEQRTAWLALNKLPT